ncbi:MAG TPA: MoaD/ThiS family protein [Candidatus Woesearchaeota archaeon]|nr:MoaD/ThiS family protein [Candidatus Woesearchaeota archaeon]
MRVFIEKKGFEEELQFSGSVSGLLGLLGLDSSEVLVVRGSEVLLDSDEIVQEDKIRIFSVISGG